MARYGAVCDNVLATEVVLADGRLVAANPREHADLFWAIRGGGGNFGIVTSFEYRLVPSRLRVVGAPLLPGLPNGGGHSRLPRLDGGSARRTADRWWADGHAGGPSSDGGFLLLRRSRARASASPIGGGSGCGQRRIPCRQARTRRSSRWVYGPSTGGGAFLPELSDAVIDVLASSYPNAPLDASAMWNDFHGAVTRVSIEATAFPLRRRGFDLFICAPWQGTEARKRVLAWVRGLYYSLQPVRRGRLREQPGGRRRGTRARRVRSELRAPVTSEGRV